jgi:DNA polymerase-1
VIALIDGDIVAYRAAAAAQEEDDWGDGQTGLTVNTKAAIYNARSLIKTWSGKINADEVVLCLSPRDGQTFRRSIAKLYKDERGAKPSAYFRVIDVLEAEYKVMRFPRLEADDVMGILATSEKLRGHAVVVSIDKDLRTVPGRLFNPLKDVKPKVITPLEADRFWMTQTLTGDPIDGYKGCPGIGPKKAEKLLAPATSLAEMWEAVRGEYLKRGLTEEDALTQARLARILRRDDYDKERHTIRLWHPNPRQRPVLTLTDDSYLA